MQTFIFFLCAFLIPPSLEPGMYGGKWSISPLFNPSTRNKSLLKSKIAVKWRFSKLYIFAHRSFYLRLLASINNSFGSSEKIKLLVSASINTKFGI